MDKHDRDELKKPDAFVHGFEVALQKAAPYKTIVFVVVGAVLVAGAGSAGYQWQTKRKETKAQTAYYLAKKSLEDLQKTYLDPSRPETPEPEKAKDAKDSKDKEKKAEVPKKPKSGDLQADFGPAVGSLERVLVEHKGSKASALAALELGKVYLEYKKYDEGLRALETVAPSLKEKELLSGFVLLELGQFQQLKGSCDQAIATWKRVSDSKDLAFFHAEALLRQGLCFESVSQKDKAAELYRKVSQDFPDSDAGKWAKKYLRLITNG